MVGRLVEQQHVGFGEQQPAQRNAAFLTTRERLDHGVPRRQTQRIGGDFELVLGVATGGGDHRFVFGLIGSKLVEIGIWFGVGGVNLIELLLRLGDFAQPLFDAFAYGFFRVERRFLLEKTDLDVGHRHRFAVVVFIDASHDFEQARFARAVQAQHADLGAGKKRQ